jgi:carbamoyl-phosphate synthase large subunit
MPNRTDIKKILIIGSGPIQIGQACEFDYSGTQAVRVLKKLGYEIVLVNSNPATIMTDPDLADRTYIEPLTPEILEMVISRERPQAVLPTLGGQVALNLVMALHREGVLETYGVEVLGARIESIELAEDREKFRKLMIGLELPVLRSETVKTLGRGIEVGEELGFPLVLRPSFTLGGTGGGIVYNRAELSEKLHEALRASPVGEVLIEESIVGWKEIEYEVMRDCKDQTVIVCGIENLDPMGIHTGDSITVAPIQTLTDKEIQRLREASKKIVAGVGVETGGCNIQYALDPQSERWVVVEMNPRVSRSSALASKATGFPIAKLAAMLAVGFSLDEIQNDITQKTPASFEPALDYVVIKIPRFAFEKFQQTEPLLGTQMKSVGEVMSFGRTFKEALLKAFDSMETGVRGLELPKALKADEIRLESVRKPRFDRWYMIAELLRSNRASLEEIHEATSIDRWFLQQLKEIIDFEHELEKTKPTADRLRQAKAMGISNHHLAKLLQMSESNLTKLLKKEKIHASLNQIDTCAGEFEAVTPYFYWAYEEFPAPVKAAEMQRASGREAVVILGSGPNRIGQGVEFDYCCVKAAEAVQEAGFDAVMINCNPETVSTDYDVSTRLYFEPLEREYVERVLEHERDLGQVRGVLCQTGGQTALKLSQKIKSSEVLGTSQEQIDRAEDRAKFDRLLSKLKLKRPKSKFARSIAELPSVAQSIGYPVLIRPSYVLGGRSMHVVRSREEMERIMLKMQSASDIEFPLLVDRFLEDAIEVDIDCVGDGQEVFPIAVMEHIEEAGIHSGDSSCTLPAMSLEGGLIEKIRKQAVLLGHELKLCGFLNIQMAIYQDEIFVLEVNPRASRTLPFVCKATGIDWMKRGVWAMLGKTFKEQGITAPPVQPTAFKHFAVKQVVFPFLKFPGVDVLLGPEMKSTGEVMGVGEDFAEAFVKGLLSAGQKIPKSGTVFVSVKDSDKARVLDICSKLKMLGYKIVATHGTARYLRDHGIVCSGINKVKEGQPHIVDAIINGDIAMVINTTDGFSAISDSYSIRRSALQSGVPHFTAMTAARAVVNSLARWIRGEIDVQPLQLLTPIGNLRGKADQPSVRKVSKA